MDQLFVRLPAGGYPIYLQNGLLAHCGALLPPAIERWFLVCDASLAASYGKTVCESVRCAAQHCELLSVSGGEASKSVRVYEELCRRLLRCGITRSDGILALGGGALGDLVGFVAATLLRGVALVHLPTTLLAQVDSSIGGKTGLDLPEGKNLLGAFYQPRMVLIDPDCLTTLPRRQWQSGIAEVIKYGMIADEAMLSQLEKPCPDWPTLIGRCVAIKASLVAQDERDGGVRRRLNFGHTFGHVYEAWGGYERWTHGEAVAAGMMQMLRWEAQHGYDVSALRERLRVLEERFSLPTAITCPIEAAQTYLLHDKKCRGDQIAAVLVPQAGRSVVREIPAAQLLEGWLT